VLGVLLVVRPSLSVGIMFISYAAHTRFHPFLDPMTPDAVQKRGGRGAIASGMQLIYVRVAVMPVLAWKPCVRRRAECVVRGPSLLWQLVVRGSFGRHSSTTPSRPCT
jgi:hypothetical protein